MTPSTHSSTMIDDFLEDLKLALYDKTPWQVLIPWMVERISKIYE